MRVSVNDVEIFVETIGTATYREGGGWHERPTLIALHGGPGIDCGYLLPYLDRLQDACQIVLMDMRGSGRSTHVDPQTLTLEVWADDVIGLVDLLGIKRPILFGHSFGGFVAMAAAVRAPDRWSGLICCDTMCTVAPNDDSEGPSLEKRGGPEAVEVATRIFSGEINDAAMAQFVAKVFPYYFGPGHEHLAAEVAPLSMIDNGVSGRWFQDLAPTYELRPQLAKLELPTMVVVGEHDFVCSPAAAAVIATAIPGAQLVAIEGAAHFPFVDEPAAFDQAMRDFIASVSRL